MDLIDLFEANLKLIANELPRIRGSYGAFLITMHPEDFLKLTADPVVDRPRIEANFFPRSKEEFTDMMGGKAENYGRFPMPFLKVYHPSGKVLGHEGRHRALMVKRKGGENFPVAIYLYTESYFILSYTKAELVETDDSYDWGNEVPMEEQFPTYDDAKARQKELRELSQDTSNEDFFSGFKITSAGRDVIKGTPTHDNPEDPWEKKPFTVADMPKVLRAEYDESITVTDYRVGLVKGYNHFR